MDIISVNTKIPYNIIIKPNILDRLGELVKNITSAKRVCIVSDSNVSNLYAKKVKSSLITAGFNTSLFIFKAGESSKRLNTINNMYSFFCENSLTRTDLVIALGGGVTGDIAGFASATYLRGIDYIQVPTSLLAQIDSSIGGKTGIDTDYGKNLVGSFHQPRAVIIDPSTLSTLNDCYFYDGLAEAIKYGCIKSQPLFERIENENPKDFILELIYECVNIKKQIVEKDELEASDRMLLNFGHTIGHSIERLYNYESLSHGQAIAIGMSLITKVSEAQTLTRPGTYKRLTSLLKKYNLPTTESCKLSDIVKYSQVDKKSIDSSINLILIKEIGKSFIYPIKKSKLLGFLETKE